MKTIASWNDLLPFGIDPLTGEACGLSYRLLCDLTDRGKKIVEKCLGIRALTLHENWNRGTPEEPHVGSIMLAPELLVPIAAFALLENGCVEAFAVPGGAVFGILPGDNREACLAEIKHFHGTNGLRRLAYSGTAGHRNVHQMTQRIE